MIPNGGFPMKHQKLSTTPEISKRMANVHLKASKAETDLAKELWRRGLRYRKNYRKLPGSPDIAILKHKIAVFVDTYNERADIQRFIDGWLIPRTNKKYCFYAPITENALSELCVDAGLQIKKVFKHDGSCFIIAAKPVDGVQW